MTDLERLLDTLIRRITRTLVRSGALVAQEYDNEEQLWLDLDSEGEDALTQLQGASIRYRIAVGPIAGRKTFRLRTPGVALEGPGREPPKPFTAARDGFSLNAAVACKAGDRRKLERLCRYVARPAIALERLSRDGDGLVVYGLKHPFSDGTTHVLFEPLDFIARLAALVPRPRSHLIRFHGLFAPNARHRRLVVPGPAPGPVSEGADQGATPTRAQMTWAQRLRRVFDIDISRCPRCGAALRVLAVITDPRVIAAILAHLETRAARAPPPVRH
ncbi:MAG: transposase [Gammaproteobacteria bacterium]|nr:transposase [Gammaproteobacteria bacterium]